jgi:type IV pilus assembly protein PilE
MSRATANAGFTLIELIIAVAIVALLASIALPSYQNYVVRSNEAVAKSFLAEVASRQQSFYNDRRRYATTLSELGYAADSLPLDRDGRPDTTVAKPIYAVAIRAGATARTYTVDAVPAGVQATRSDCGTLSLDAQGVRSASGSRGDDCWKR